MWFNLDGKLKNNLIFLLTCHAEFISASRTSVSQLFSQTAIVLKTKNEKELLSMRPWNRFRVTARTVPPEWPFGGFRVTGCENEIPQSFLYRNDSRLCHSECNAVEWWISCLERWDSSVVPARTVRASLFQSEKWKTKSKKELLNMRTWNKFRVTARASPPEWQVGQVQGDRLRVRDSSFRRKPNVVVRLSQWQSLFVIPSETKDLLLRKVRFLSRSCPNWIQFRRDSFGMTVACTPTS